LRGNLDRGLAAPPEAEPGTLTVYSAKEGQAAVDGDGFNSPFARAFMTELKVPGRDVRRMFDDVSDDVIETTSKRQQPFIYGWLPGKRDFFFVAGKFGRLSGTEARSVRTVINHQKSIGTMHRSAIVLAAASRQ
jgi:hypothetical protein